MEAKFTEICSRLFYNGLLVAMITDRDGVIILKCSSEKATNNMIDPIVPTTFSIANNQASKLGLDRNQSIISVYDQYQIIQFNQTPLIITLIAESNSNTGLFINLGHSLLEMTEEIVNALKE